MKAVKAKNGGVDEGENEDGWSDDAPSWKIAQRWFVLTPAYDSGELSGALAEGQPQWKNWAKNFGIETLDLIVWCQLLFGVKAKASSVIPGADQIAEAFKKPLLSVKSRTSSMVLRADQIAETSKNRCLVLRQRFLPFLVLIRLLKHLNNRCLVSRQRLLP
ncbi:hypothetical protein BC332_15538 [Capsicum chinense]|nr:hypothetical protein BC332_15538 [Capsicum chinense]